MTKEKILEDLAQAVIDGNKNNAIDAANSVLNAGVDVAEAISEGLAKGMAVMGDRYEAGEVFLPHLMVSSAALYGGLDVLSPHLKKSESGQEIIGVIGTIEGDVHDIGKNLVKTMMIAAGMKMIDLGKDVPLDNFISAAKENKANFISVSSLMTTTMVGMETIIENLKESGMRDSVLMMVGGAPISVEYANQIGADGTAPDAAGAVDAVKEKVKKQTSADERWDEKKIALSQNKYRKELLKKKVSAEEEVDITLESTKDALKYYNEVTSKRVSQMTHNERIQNILNDKKVDHPCVVPLFCSIGRKFVNSTYNDYSTNPEKFSEVVAATIKYLDVDSFVGLTDLAVTAADVGAGVTYPEENTASASSHLEDYEELEVPEVKPGTRVYNLIESSKKATEKLHKLGAPFVAFHEGPLLTLTQSMGADRVFADMESNPNEVLKYVDNMMDFVFDISDTFFKEHACDYLCIDNLWSNNTIMSEDAYWKFEGKFIYDRHLPLFNKYQSPYVIHNCAEFVHFDTQIRKFGTGLFSYAYYDKLKNKGAQSHVELIPKYTDICCMMGEVDPIQFMYNDEANIQNIKNDTKELMDSAFNILKESGFKTKYMVSTGCEVPPHGSLNACQAMVETVKEFGPDIVKKYLN